MRHPSILSWVLLIGLLGANPRSAVAAARPPAVLIVMAHPDDETMIGDLLGRMKERGVRVTLALVTNGERGKVVRGLRPEGERRPGEDPLVERTPGDGVPGIRTPTDLARARRRELRAAARFHGVEQVVFLSPDLAEPRFVDGWEGGVRSWPRKELGRRLAELAKELRPEVVITLNPHEPRNHPQHRGLGRLVSQLHASGGFDGPGGRPSLYGIREQDWYHGSLAAQPGDERFARDVWSWVLGRTYRSWMELGADVYRTQSSRPRYAAARNRAGLNPGVQPESILRRLDDGPGDRSLTALLAAHAPRLRLRDRLDPGRALRNLLHVLRERRAR
ncbi:MAG: PIG-L family deacetylase [Deltaproteobacteria bacterium]|nr:PIG-L family deacetylase [Deltaproteobacteria bacterium]